MIKNTLLLCSLLLSFNSCFAANSKIVAYLGADHQWQLSHSQLQQLRVALKHITHVDYAFVRFTTDAQGNTLLKPSKADLHNLRTIRSANASVPIILSIGGWGARNDFGFVSNANKRKIFVNSVAHTLKALQAQGFKIAGIDVDWENELLASSNEIEGVGHLFAELRTKFGPNFLITNAVPATAAYWVNYPNAKLWSAYVNWTTVMAYDHYGTFGPTAELASALYDSHVGEPPKDNCPYPPTSANFAIQHYLQQGLAAKQILLGLPFYCHSYYLANKKTLGDAVIDPNISSQVDYNEAFTAYGTKLSQYTNKGIEQNYVGTNYFGIIPLALTKVSRFMSCENPRTITAKMDYVRGNNPYQETLAGVSFWSLLQDLPYENENSLLRAITVQPPPTTVN